MMKAIKKECVLEEFADIAALQEGDRDLLYMAGSAVGGAWAPYSGFQVGCAIRLANGMIVTGSNQENKAYPSGLCAERVAIFHAGASYPGVAIETIAITVHSAHAMVNEPITSCGACLQSISEYELRYRHPIRMVLRGETGPVWIATGIATFMPFAFDGKFLGK